MDRYDLNTCTWMKYGPVAASLWSLKEDTVLPANNFNVSDLPIATWIVAHLRKPLCTLAHAGKITPIPARRPVR
jgi:hypothetical protein